MKTWLVTGVSPGFGRGLTDQLLARGDRFVGTVRDTAPVADLFDRCPDAFTAELLDVTDTTAVRAVVSNAGYGLSARPTRRSPRFGVGLAFVEPAAPAPTSVRQRPGRRPARAVDRFEAQTDRAGSTDYPRGE